MNVDAILVLAIIVGGIGTGFLGRAVVLLSRRVERLERERER